MSEAISRSVVPDQPYIRGKFIYLRGKKYSVRGVTYGAFPPHPRGDWFPDDDIILKDFRCMRAAGINTILTYTLPSTRILDLAHESGLKAILNIPWFGSDYYLERHTTQRALRELVKLAIRPLRSHPAILMWCVGKELAPDIVRWYGKQTVESLLHSLYVTAKNEDPDALISFTNFPTTEYIALPFWTLSLTMFISIRGWNSAPTYQDYSTSLVKFLSS
jgi:O-antigen biosynthesis protein